jgi:hypothetical protein
MTKVERVVEFLKRITAALPASSASSAFDLIVRTFVAVEEEMAGDDDPMFPPSGNFYYDVQGRDDLLLFRRQAGHETIIRTTVPSSFATARPRPSLSTKRATTERR